MQTALLRARQTRQPVVVSSMTSQTSTTVANPNGSFSTATHVLPVRVRQNGRWVPVSARLRRVGAGWEASATPSAVVLSPGGNTPLVTLTNSSADRLSLTFPFRLPAPVISGATATYRGVLPGVDLVATVTDQGGFSDVLVVHDAAAAAALRQLRIAVSTSGLSVRTDRYGNMTATNAGGRIAFVAPAPSMWDAAAGRGMRGHMAAMEMTAVRGGLILTPSVQMLTARSTRYPVYMDPAVNPVTSTTAGYVEAQTGRGPNGSDCGTYRNWNNASTAPLGIGYQNYPNSYCQGIYRSYYQINTTNLNPSMHVTSATLNTQEQWASDLNCSHSWPVTLRWTGGIGPGTDGNNEPGIVKTLQTMNPRSASPGCGYRDVNFDVTQQMQGATGWANWTFGLYGDEALVGEGTCSPSNNCGFMRFNDNPYIVTSFDIAPNIPANPGTTPPAHNPDTAGCNSSGPYGWIGRSDIGPGDGSSVTLDATVSSNIVGEAVQAQWTILDYSVSGNPAGSHVVAYQNSSFVSSGTTVDTPIGIALQDGHPYGYRAWSYDGTLLSDGSTGDCSFNVDLTPPTVPEVTSTAFPPSGSSPGTSLHVGQSGTFSFASTDPVPTGCSSTCLSSGLADFEYSFNAPIPTVGASTVNPGTAVSFTPTQWGTNILYVDAVDNAGNRSQVAQYDFYVPFNPGATVTPGDINGDGVPDLLATNTAGNLLLYPGNTDPAVSPVTAGTPATSPDGTGWNTFQITHRGSMSQGTVDDLFAHKGSSLYIYANGGGSAPQFADTANLSTVTKPGCAATADNTGNCGTYPASWSAVTQVLAPGDVYAGRALDNGLPSLLTVENDQLWAYQGTFGSALTRPVLLGTSGWGNMTLIAPGTVGGVLSLWARDTTTGDLYSYPLTLDASGLPVGLGPATGSGSAGTLIGNMNLPAGTYPTLASPGDLTGSGYPGLYAEDTSGNLWFYPGQSTSGGATPLAGTRQLVGTVNQAAAQWTLTDGSGSTAADATGGGNAGTLTGGVSWATGTGRGTVASFDGSSGAIATSGPVVNTAGDYSVSGWAYLTSLGTWADVATQDGNSASGFYLQYSTADDRWALSIDASDSSSSSTRALSPSPPALNTWTHLVGTYDAATGQMDLYVNGQLAGTAVDTTPWPASGPFAIGRGKWGGAMVDWFPGYLSDVEAFDYTLTPSEVTALYQGQLPVTQLS